MQLTDQHIDNFISLYKTHYGVVLGRTGALEKGLEICQLVKLVALDNENEYGEKGRMD